MEPGKYSLNNRLNKLEARTVARSIAEQMQLVISVLDNDITLGAEHAALKETTIQYMLRLAEVLEK